MLIDEDTALLGDDQTPADPADGDQTDLGDDATRVPGDDTAGADDTDGEGDDGDQGEGDDKGDDPNKTVPYGRFKEVNDRMRDAETRAERLEGQVEYLAQMVAKQQSGDRVSEKQQDKAQDALDALIQSGEIKKEEAVKLQRIIDAMGYRRGDEKPDSRVQQLEGKVEQLTKLLGDKADREEKQTVLKQYGDIITEEDLDSVMKEWAKSRDPELKYAAQHWSYEKIVKLAFHDKIVASEVDKAIRSKKKPAPDIAKKGGDKAPKKPQRDDFEWEPGNGEGSMEALKRSILAETASAGE